jgi:anti-anti-sigma factor
MTTGVTSAVLGDVPMLVATGAMDRDTCGSLQSALDKLIEARHNVFFLDLSDATHMDSGGLTVIRAGVQALGQRGWIGLIGMNADARRLLEADGLLVNPRIRVFGDRQAARIATGERAST